MENRDLENQSSAVDRDKEKLCFLLQEYEQLWVQARHIDEHQEPVPRTFLTTTHLNLVLYRDLDKSCEIGWRVDPDG